MHRGQCELPDNTRQNKKELRRRIKDYLASLPFSVEGLKQCKEEWSKQQDSPTEFSMLVLEWLGIHSDQLQVNEQELRHEALIYAYEIATSLNTRKDWVEIHGRLWWMLNKWPRDLTFQLINPRSEFRTSASLVNWWDFVSDWLHEPQLSQFALWLWQEHVGDLDADTCFFWLRQALLPVVISGPGLFGPSRDVAATIQAQSSGSLFDLIEAQSGKDKQPILSTLRNTHPARLLELLLLTLETSLFLDNSRTYDAPPQAHTEISRPSIEDSSQTEGALHSYEKYVPFLLVEIRDTLTILKEAEEAAWHQVLAEMNTSRWFAVHRLVMHALSECEGVDGVDLIEEWLGLWVDNYTSRMNADAGGASDAHSEYHHELWRLLNRRSADLVNYHPDGWKQISSTLSKFERFYIAMFKLVEDADDQQKQRYVDRQLFTWLWAVEPALDNTNLRSRKNALKHFRDHPETFGVNRDSDTFSSYMYKGGLVQYQSDRSADEFALMIETEGVNAAVTLLIDKPPRRNIAFMEEGGIVDQDYRDMLREFAKDHLRHTVMILRHTSAMELDTNYLSHMCYGINDAVEQLPSPQDRKDNVRVVSEEADVIVGAPDLITNLISACKAALVLRQALASHPKIQQQLNGALMALTNLARKLPLDESGDGLLALIELACNPQQFSYLGSCETTTEEDSALGFGVRKKRAVYEQVLALAYHDVSEPLNALLNYTGRLHNWLRKSKDRSYMREQEPLLLKFLAVLAREVEGSMKHPYSFYYAAFTGVFLYDLMVLAHEHKKDCPALDLAVQHALEHATALPLERDSRYGEYLCIGYLFRGHAHSSYLNNLLVLYRWGMKHSEEYENDDKYAESIGGAYLRLWINRKMLVREEADDSIKELVAALFSSKTKSVSNIQKWMIAQGRMIPAPESSEKWFFCLGDLYELVKGLNSEAAIITSASLFQSMLGWIHTIPRSMSIDEHKPNSLNTPESILHDAIEACKYTEFNAHDLGSLLTVLVDRAVNTGDFSAACRLVHKALEVISEVHNRGESSQLLPWWAMRDVWKLIDINGLGGPDTLTGNLIKNIQELLEDLEVPNPSQPA